MQRFLQRDRWLHVGCPAEDDGIMVIHSIGFCRSGQWNHGGWMNSYIFPGAELPTMSLAKDKSCSCCSCCCGLVRTWEYLKLHSFYEYMNKYRYKLDKWLINQYKPFFPF